ncbi:hypothetical protein FACS189427_02860 [Planctomycetales bacterium]|nr:hypothetical protein FACS189427_02860 [Planctomycetales bacterium]
MICAALDKQIERNDNLKTTLKTQISNKDNLISELHKQISDIDEEIALLQKEHDGLTQDFVLNASSNGKILNGNTIDTQEDLQILGTVSGNGMLVKKGAGKTLTLSGTNTYTGGTKIDEGTVAISRKDNLGTGDVIFNGGTLKNTAAISNFNNNIITNRNKNAIFETENDLTIKGVISGSGGLIKTGDAELALYGNNSYTGGTLVQNGTLAVNGKSYSDTTVMDGAILRGKGTIAGNVKFESGSAYEWYAGHTLAEKDCLTVLGNVELNNTAFLAVTAGGSASYFQYDLNGQEVLKYDNLTGDKQFASVNNDYSPFYIFTLDYSEQGVVKVLTHKRSEALGLSDGVAVGLNMAQRRAHRRPFDHIDFSFRNARYALPETLNGTWIRKHQQALETGGYRGQNVSKTHNAWGDIYIRGTQYDSTFFTNDWKMCSVGFQGGYSFYADQNLEWGLTAGAECPELKNSGDKITMSDGYLGLYYGQRLQRNWEFKGYVGGGTQRYESKRFDAAYTYKTRYYGESFQANVEFARPLRTPYFVLRPLAGFDFEYVQQEAAYENRPGQNAEQRYYSKASLTQLFTKVGLDFQRPIRCGDAYFGISYSNMIAGDSQSVVGVYYPKAGMSGKIRAASLGQNIFTFRLGANHYLNGRDYSILYWNFTADEYADRFGGKGEFSGTVGYSYRF